jgi:hypothetical protein
MALWMAVVMAAAAIPPGDGELPRTVQIDDDWSAAGGVAAVRVGAWAGREFSFQAVRSDSTQATSKQQAFFSASVLGGLELYEHFVILGTYEADLASKISAQVGGAYLGWREHPKEKYGKGVPDSVTLYAGVLVGRLDVKQDDFGSFDRGTGFGGGLALGWSLSAHASVELYGEYRFLRFDYNRDVLSGDKSIGGSSGWFGLGLDYRF